LFQTTSSSPLVWSIIPANCVLVCTTCKEGVQPSAIPAHLNKKHEIVIVTIAYRTTTAKPRFRHIAESRTSQDAQKRQPAFFRPHCVPNPKIAEIHLLRHCRDRDVMFGRRDTEHKAMEVYRYYRSLRDSLSDSRLKSLKSLESLKSLKSLKSFRSIPPCLSLCIDSATRPVPTSATFSYVPDSTLDAEPSLPINRHIRPRSLVVGVGRRALSLVGVAP